MYRFIFFIFLPLFLSSAAAETVFDANRTKLQAYLLSTGTFDISGEFSQYDFPDVDTAFDWTFTTPAGSVYQLQGIAPSQNDVFGWKAVSVTPSYAMWYMAYIGDWDGDGETRFDWVLAGNGFDAIYKLAGVSASGNFAYSDPFDLPYLVSFDGKQITFGDASTPQYTVSSPGSGGIVVQIEQNNGSDYIDFYGDAASGLISKAQGVAAGYYFEITYSQNAFVRYLVKDVANRMTYTFDADGTINSEPLQFIKSADSGRTLSSEACHEQAMALQYFIQFFVSGFDGLVPIMDYPRLRTSFFTMVLTVPTVMEAFIAYDEQCLSNKEVYACILWPEGSSNPKACYEVADKPECIAKADTFDYSGYIFYVNPKTCAEWEAQTQ